MTDVPLAGSVRMIFELAGDGLRLVEQHPVHVPGRLLPDRQPGDYVEVRARDGRGLSRVPVWTGLGTSVESFPEDPYIGASPARVVTVVVPALPDADHVAVVRDDGVDGVVVLGTFPLHTHAPR